MGETFYTFLFSYQQQTKTVDTIDDATIRQIQI